MENQRINFLIIVAVGLTILFFLFDIRLIDNWTDVLVEAHGLLFDVILFGIVLSIFNKIKSKKENILRLQEELEDYRYWDEKEAVYRIIGIIKRLNSVCP